MTSREAPKVASEERDSCPFSPTQLRRKTLEGEEEGNVRARAPPLPQALSVCLGVTGKGALKGV